MPHPSDSGRTRAYLQAFQNRYLEYLPMWTIYRPTAKDHEGQWSARLWLTLPTNLATDVLVTADDKATVLGWLPEGLTKLARSPGDDPVIEETWI